jgi:hypothetical protein
VTGPRLREAADTVAEGIAALHRLTLGPDDQLEGPADVQDVISSLSLALSRMPQLLGQLAVFLEIEQVKGAVSDHKGGDAGEHVRAVSDALHRAGLDAEAMAAALDAAHEACHRVQPLDPGRRRDASRGLGTQRGDDR